jgi:two-component system OmpR family sensor kinase
MLLSVCLLALTCLAIAYTENGLSQFQTWRVLTLSAAGVCAGAAVMALLCAKLTDDAMVRDLGMALEIYGFVAVPVTALTPATTTGLRIAQGVEALACAGILVLLARAGRTARRRGGSPVAWRLGAGVAVLAALEVAITLDGWLVFAFLRLGVGILLLVPLAVLAEEVSISQRVRVVAYRRRLSRVAEREHELRNALLGLSGAASVLRNVSTVDERLLSEAVEVELSRLQRLLDDEMSPVEGQTAVEPALRRLVALHAATGMAVTLDAEDDLRAALPSSAFARVITNLLANCAQHAPGASVRVEARGVHGLVRVEVSDDGPGVIGGDRVLRRGVRGPDSSGSGLGLYLCDQIVRAHGGELRLIHGLGCTVIVDVPIAGRWILDVVA